MIAYGFNQFKKKIMFYFILQCSFFCTNTKIPYYLPHLPMPKNIAGQFDFITKTICLLQRLFNSVYTSMNDVEN